MGERITNKVIYNKIEIKQMENDLMKKEERKITVELLEAERTNTYKILAEFLAKKFSEKGFDKAEKK